MKKLLLGLGTLMAASTPVIAMVSCGKSDFNSKSTSLVGEEKFEITENIIKNIGVKTLVTKEIGASTTFKSVGHDFHEVTPSKIANDLKLDGYTFTAISSDGAPVEAGATAIYQITGTPTVDTEKTPVIKFFIPVITFARIEDIAVGSLITKTGTGSSTTFASTGHNFEKVTPAAIAGDLTLEGYAFASKSTPVIAGSTATYTITGTPTAGPTSAKPILTFNIEVTADAVAHVMVHGSKLPIVITNPNPTATSTLTALALTELVGHTHEVSTLKLGDTAPAFHAGVTV